MSGRVKACTECRQQKQRCDAYKDYSEPCSRCKKTGGKCIITDSFERRKKHTKADLQRELDQLKDLVGGPTRNFAQGNSSIPQTVFTESVAPSLHSPASVAPNQLNQQNQTSPRSIPSSYSDLNMSSASQQVDNAGLRSATNNPTSHYQTFDMSADSEPSPHSLRQEYLLDGGIQRPTVPQSLADIHVDGKKIDECFALFYRHYVPLMHGIFDPAITPNQRFLQSPLLFWAIVCTGARRYTKDPTIFARLSKQMVAFALSSLVSSPRPVPSIQAIILLCAWPLPMNTIYKDPSHALAGAAMNMAIQNGLHVLCHELDFASRPTKQREEYISPKPGCSAGATFEVNFPDADSEGIFRIRLWVHCLIIFQSTSLCDGLPFPVIPESGSGYRSQLVHSTLSTSVAYRYTMHKILSDAVTAITRAVRLETHQDSLTLNTLIGIFDGQIQDLVADETDDTCRLIQICARLSVRAFHFYAAPDHTDRSGMLQLCSIACETIQYAWNLNSSSDFATYMNNYFARMIILAAYCILRIAKSHLNQHFDAHRAEEMFFLAIEISKKRSIENNDLDSINAKMLTQLWGSTKMFVQKDGSNSSLQLHLRGRLFMSVLFDCFWWWRREFGDLPDHGGGQSNLVTDNEQQHDKRSSEAAQVSTSGEAAGELYVDADFSLETSRYFLGQLDWDWEATMAAFDNGLYADHGVYRGFPETSMAENGIGQVLDLEKAMN